RSSGRDAPTQPEPAPSFPLREGGLGGLGPVAAVLRYTAERLVPDLRRTSEELDNLLCGLRGEYVPAGPSGAPTRGMANVLPTGRNFYSVDPNTIPSPAAWEVGQGLGRALLDKYLAEEG